MSKQYCSSVYIIDFEKKSVLLMYNKKLKKWLQPGGHIEGDELPFETCLREAKEETGIEAQLLNKTSFTGFTYQPICVEQYINKVGDMIDFQFVAFPLTFTLNDTSEHNLAKWQSIDTIDSESDIDEEIKVKVKRLLNQFSDEYFTYKNS